MCRLGAGDGAGRARGDGGSAVRISDPPIASTGANPAGKVTSIVAGMVAGAGSNR